MPLWISPSKKFKTKKEAAPFETASFIITIKQKSHPKNGMA